MLVAIKLQDACCNFAVYFTIPHRLAVDLGKRVAVHISGHGAVGFDLLPVVT